MRIQKKLVYLHFSTMKNIKGTRSKNIYLYWYRVRNANMVRVNTMHSRAKPNRILSSKQFT